MSRFISLVDELPRGFDPGVRRPDVAPPQDSESPGRLIEALVKAEDLDRIRAGFDAAGITHASIVGCSTFASDSGATVTYRGATMKLDGAPRFMLRICVAPAELTSVIDLIRGKGESGVIDVVVHHVSRMGSRRG